MPQRKVHLVTLHGEDAAIALGQGVDRAGKMGGICRCSEVVYHVAGSTMLSPELNRIEAWKMVS